MVSRRDAARSVPIVGLVRRVAGRKIMGPAGYQRWRGLLFMHWPVPLQALRPLVPSALALDSFAGQAYISLIPFVIAESRPASAPAALATRFLETNLRTYVRAPDGEPGIYFFSLEASSLLAVAAARLLFGLPYFPAAMSTRREGSSIDYVSRRRGARDTVVEVTWSVDGATAPAAPGTRDHFLIERYSLYVTRRTGLYRGRVRHPPYPLHRAVVRRLRQTVVRAAGLPEPTQPPFCHCSPGVDVDIFWLERIATSPG
ncbi:MAG: hypothetical protein DMD87_13080 [Candidatus Rokuibacteriota bacterium]|nr:MAG: hypothetical protein DMD87_13080 [Candidatus Rokubacteria bacterium]